MRIAFVTNNYTPYSGGVISSINAITNALRAQGHEVYIITLDFLGADHHNDPDYVIRLACPIKFMYKKNHMAIPWRPTHTITKILQTYKPDIVHVHHPFLLGVSALRAARTLNIPCVFTYHTMYEEYAHYAPLPTLCTKPIIRTAVQRFCNAVDAIIVPSNAIKEYLLAQQVTSPINVIPSPLRSHFLTDFTPHRARPELVEGSLGALEENPFAPVFVSLQTGDPIVRMKMGNNCSGRAQYKNKNLFDQNFFNLLTVSRFVPEKNIPFVFDVLKKLPSTITLTLVGYGTDYEYLQHLAFETFQFSPERVKFIHKPEQKDLLNYYRNADLFLFPSQTDTQGLVLAESMSQGLPVIALDGAGQRDIIINGINGFIIKDTDDAAHTIMNIANNTQLLHSLKSNALTTAQNYRPDIITTKIVNLYHTIAS